MFGRKPPPAHCENLSDAQVKLVRKMLKQTYPSSLNPLSRKALENGWPEVLVAYLNRGNLRKNQVEWVMHPLIYGGAAIPDRCTALLMTLPAIGKTSFDMQGSYLGSLLIWAAGDSEMQEQAFALVTNTRARGHALHRILYLDDLTAHAHAIDLLFSRDFDMYFDSAALMKHALEKEHFEIVDRLMARGFDVHLYSRELLDYAAKNDISHAARAQLDALLRKTAVVAPVAATAVVEQESGYTRSGDMVSRSDVLADGATLTTVFNFASAQQVMFTRIDNTVSAPVVVPFSLIEERRQLNAAAVAFVAQGGDAALTDTIAPTARKPIVHKAQGMGDV